MYESMGILPINENLLSYQEMEPRPLSVLVVEDDIFFQARFTSLLRTLDFETQVDRVASVEEAKELLKNAPDTQYNLIIADQFLKGDGTGLDLWDHCRYNYPDSQFLLTSGQDMSEYLSLNDQPVPDFLPKSSSQQESINKILETLHVITNEVALPPTKNKIDPLPKMIWWLALIYIGAIYYHLTA